MPQCNHNWKMLAIFGFILLCANIAACSEQSVVQHIDQVLIKGSYSRLFNSDNSKVFICSDQRCSRGSQTSSKWQLFFDQHRPPFDWIHSRVYRHRCWIIHRDHGYLQSITIKWGFIKECIGNLFRAASERVDQRKELEKIKIESDLHRRRFCEKIVQTIVDTEEYRDCNRWYFTSFHQPSC